MYTYAEALDAMEKIASDLFKEAGVKARVSVTPDIHSGTASVSWGNEYSYAHGGSVLTVNMKMPVLPAQQKISKQEFENYAGFNFHEVGHPLETDWTTWQLGCNQGYGALLNALEDVRIEKALIDRKLAKNGQLVLEKLCHQLDYTALQKGFDANDPRNIGFVMSFLGRARNGYDLDTRLIKLDPQGSVAKALVWALPELSACVSTKDCLNLAKKLLKALPKKEPKSPKGPEPQKGEGSQGEGSQGEGSQGEGSQGEGSQGEGSQGEGSQGEGSQGEGKGDESPESQPKGGGQGAGGSAGGERLEAKDVRPVSLMPKHASELHDKRGAYASKTASDMVNVIAAVRQAAKDANNDVAPGQHNSQSFDVDSMRADAAKASRQRALLAKALKCNEQDIFEGGLKHGKLDRRAFARMAAGAPNVFGRREMTDGYETDAIILVDGSGSMEASTYDLNDKGRIKPAATMALIIAQAAAQVGVSCTTYLFGGVDGGRNNPLGLFEVNKGKQKPTAEAFAGMPLMTGGGTPLSASMLAVAIRQAKSAKGKRRVMFVVSDGMCTNGPATLKAVATYIESAMGTELAHMGIGMKPQGCFRNETYVPSTGDIAGVGIDALTAKLAKGL